MRKKSTNETPTPTKIVKKMVDYLEPIKLEATYCEPCCWSTPFLLEILKRKLRLCYSYDDVLTAFKTCYGYEYHEDNLEEGKENLKSLLPYDKNISLIVNTNLILMDGLTGKNPKTGEVAEMYNWKEGRWEKVKDA